MLVFLRSLFLLLLYQFNWYVAPALVKLTTQVNFKWPKRDKSSDGSIGDAAHRNRKSDHNPNGRGSVNAKDLDKDGPDMNLLLEAAKKHPSVNYIIWQGYIYSRAFGFAKRRYTGSNGHFMHMHISLIQSAAAENNLQEWDLGGTTVTPAPVYKVSRPAEWEVDFMEYIEPESGEHKGQVHLRNGFMVTPMDDPAEWDWWGKTGWVSNTGKAPRKMSEADFKRLIRVNA